MLITFVIVNRMLPKKVSEHIESTRKWARCKIRITECDVKEYKNTYMVYEGYLPSCAPYFIFKAPCRMLKKKIARLPVVNPLKAGMVWTYRKKETRFTPTEKQFLAEEVLASKAFARSSIPALVVRQNAKKYTYVYEFKDDKMFYEACDYFRIELELMIKKYFPKQDTKVKSMSVEELNECIATIRTTPWELMFEQPFAVKEMALVKCNQARIDNKINAPRDIRVAMRLYDFIKTLQARVGHTLFVQTEVEQQYMQTENWRHNPGDTGYFTKAFELLKDRCITYVDDNEFARKQDVHQAERITSALTVIKGNALQTMPEVRDPDDQWANIEMHELTNEQVDAVTHATTNWLTMILGGPGHGKSEAIVHFIKTYAKVLVVTYVGKAVDVLLKRTNSYEHVYTIHFVYYKAKFNPEWIEQFDMIVIDEMSNVDDVLFANLMTTIQDHMCRVVLVGDLAQINPIDPGNPFRDLVETITDKVFYLTENLRQVGNSRTLADVSVAIKNNEITPEHFDTQCLKLVKRDTIKNTMTSQLARFCYEMETFQVICLRKAECKQMNLFIEEWLHEHGVVVIPKNARQIRFNFRVFPGKKIMFTKNNKFVRNGEIDIIERVIPRGAIVHLKMKHSKKLIKIGEGDDAVNPINVDYGYAITCNKSQGSEWPDVLFWIHADPADFWTREYLYVAESRAKESCTVVGTYDDVKKLCRNSAPQRKTVLKHYIETTNLGT